MKLSLVLISSYKSWQGNKDICTLLYFYKRLARKKNLRHVISFFFPPPLLSALSQRLNPAPPPSEGRKKGGLARGYAASSVRIGACSGQPAQAVSPAMGHSYRLPSG